MYNTINQEFSITNNKKKNPIETDKQDTITSKNHFCRNVKMYSKTFVQLFDNYLKKKSIGVTTRGTKKLN